MKNPEFLFRGADVATYPPGAILGPRRAAYYEIVWIIEGDIRWTFDGVTHAMPAGSLFMRPPGAEECYYWDQERTTRHAYVEFDVLPGCTNPFMNMEWPVSVIAEPDSILALLMRHMVHLFQTKGDNWEPLSTYALNCCISLYATNNAELLRSHESAEFPPEIRRIITHVSNVWVTNEPMRTFSVEEMMAMGNVSRATLFRLFQKYFEMSPVQVLRKARLERGASLLIRTELKVQEIAFQTGFDMPFHFSKRFKQLFGMCPTEFRKQHRDRQHFSFNTSLLSRLLQGYEA